MKATKAKFKFDGGIHPAYHKELARDRAIETMPIPALLRVSMSQHLGAPAKPLVKKGDTVKRGQCIGEAAGFISAAVHAPTSGTIKEVGTAPTAMGTSAAFIAIEPDGEDAWIEGLEGIADWQNADTKALIAKVAAAGIAGMGGAGFPTNVKLSPPPDKPIDTLILNGAECEPYLTADHRLMVEHAEQIWTGCQIVRKVLGAKHVHIAIEDNKPEAIAAMEQAMEGADDDASISILKTEYPQGAEKQQIYATTGREVPSGGLPMDVGCVVENVGTTLAVWDAVVNGKPLTERVTTVTGMPVSEPKNVLGRIGIPYSDLLDFCGGLKADVAKIISGGPMMGLAQPGLDATTTKTTSGLLFLAPQETQTFRSMPCIACGRCVGACPMYLVPAELSQMLEAEDYEAAEELNVLDCIECGCCAFACPAHRPLVQHMKQGKSKVMLKRRQAQKK
ncbi:MAG: electron transport complex subunit RsxC [Verrucomicrobia bacterium]|jgi:Na+-translocating ferredoxin:NAD+ oxidoreductase subunit C|nr:electron transport complex subunit RsxC [Verrucomicrobiota bacterium]